MDNRIIKTENVKWQEINDLQPSNSKKIENDEILKASITKYGFSEPFYVWQDKKTEELFALDGHSRKRVLMTMENVPEMLPATFINAKNKKEALAILIEVYNQRRNKFDKTQLEGLIKSNNFDFSISSIDFVASPFEFVPPVNQDDQNDKGETGANGFSGEVSVNKENQLKKTDDANASFEMVMPYNAKLDLIKAINEIQAANGYEFKYESLIYLVSLYNQTQNAKS